jgi:hypothetical protein
MRYIAAEDIEADEPIVVVSRTFKTMPTMLDEQPSYRKNLTPEDDTALVGTTENHPDLCFMYDGCRASRRYARGEAVTDFYVVVP